MALPTAKAAFSHGATILCEGRWCESGYTMFADGQAFPASDNRQNDVAITL